MAYTNVWSTATPANSDPATAAADIRKLRLDIQERMETLVGAGNWGTDPVPLSTNNMGQYLPWQQFQPYSGAASWSAVGGSLYGVSPNAGGTYTFYCPIVIPRGVTITELEITGQTNVGSTNSLTATLESIDATTGTVAQTTLATATIPTQTPQTTKSSGVVSVAIDSTATNYIFYYVKLVMVANASGTCWFQGVRVKYTRTNIGQSV